MTGADFSEIDRDGTRTLVFTGALTLSQLGDLPNRLETEPPQATTIDLANVGQMDTIGAWVVHRLSRDTGATITGASADNAHLIAQVSRSDTPMKVRPDHVLPLVRVLGEIGEATQIAGRTLLGLLGFFGAICIALANVIRHPSRFRVDAVVQRFEIVGVKAFGIIGLMRLSDRPGHRAAGRGPAGAIRVRKFHDQPRRPDHLPRARRADDRDHGRGALGIGAFAAELGTMKLTEEIDAMRTIGISPNEALVLPRIFATVLMMPLLGFYASMVAVIGGGLFCWTSLGIQPVTYIQRIREVVPDTDVYIGLIKAFVFGLIISASGCYQGLQVEGNAEQVGLRTTASVVQAIFLVIVLDAFFAVFFTSIGWR